MSTVVSDEKATAKTAPKEYRQFIDGEWVAATNGASYGDYRATVHLATSAGNFSISSKTLHRLVAA